MLYNDYARAIYRLFPSATRQFLSLRKRRHHGTTSVKKSRGLAAFTRLLVEASIQPHLSDFSLPTTRMLSRRAAMMPPRTAARFASLWSAILSARL